MLHVRRREFITLLGGATAACATIRRAGMLRPARITRPAVIEVAVRLPGRPFD